MIDMNDRSVKNILIDRLWLVIWQRHRVRYLGTELIRRNAQRQMGSNGREYIAAVKCRADRLPKILLVFDGGDVRRSVVKKAKQAVVRPDEKLSVRIDDHSTTVRSDARIDYTAKDSRRWKILMARPQNKSRRRN